MTEMYGVWVPVSVPPTLCWNFADVTLTDNDINSIPADDANTAWYSSNLGWNGWVKMCLSFYGGKHSELLYLRCLYETGLKFWIKIKCEKVKSDLWNRFRLINFEPSAINDVELSIWTLKNREKKREFQYQTLENRE